MKIFKTGRIVTTPSVAENIAPEDIISLIKRHKSGDWGKLCNKDCHQNNKSIKGGGRIISKYLSSADESLYVITEADRSVTTVLYCDEY